MSYSSSQRTALTQFMQFTQVQERQAAKILKSNSWNLELAIDSYYQNAGTAAPASSGIADKNSINAIFESFRSPTDSADNMSIGGTMAYFEAIGLNIEDSTVLALSEALKSPSMGELTREGFLEGWGTRGLSCDTIDKMRNKLPALKQSMEQDEEFFKRVYLWTFNWARTPGQKALPIEVAIEWWKLLFQNKFSGHLDHWIHFLTEKWNKSVPKDTWNMLYDFVKFAEGDSTLGSYDEMGAWPSVIDGYVEYYRSNQQ